MTVHPVSGTDTPAPRPVQDRPVRDDSSAREAGGTEPRPDTASAYDSTWAEHPAAQSQQPSGLDRVMGADGKIYVVLAVVLLIWFGLVTMLVRTDRKIDRLERRFDAFSSQDSAPSDDDA